jgi:hypothetical protein
MRGDRGCQAICMVFVKVETIILSCHVVWHKKGIEIMLDDYQWHVSMRVPTQHPLQEEVQ